MHTEGDMDFNIVRKQILTAYRNGHFLPWSCQDFIEVFERFYGMYCTRRAQWHPVLKTTTIGRVMELLVEDVNGVRYSPEDYLETDLLDCYFMTQFNEGCDYSIVHFTSGDVRMFKSYEAVI